MNNVPTHPHWCDRQTCTVTPDRPAGAHCSRPVLLRPEDREAMYLRITLHQSTGLPVLCVEGFDQDPAKDPNPLALLALSTRQATITAHLLRRLVRLATRDAVVPGLYPPGSKINADRRFRR
ncbi:hypothetical protein U2F26_23945 [Micromonospora sp. 4G57]|uniref:Uncharacterized protein n=1 Tax=Micromonospora sicca TaxID=2202420 RepID=A0ABU5JGB3_9ACTN|nr:MULTISPECIES: hypothetical protein [unclassified Micromonospora]MDZ5445746.1 hypothetical protein [Micromonospora sp. 4G57]MDZ5491652.1 hypothetical protein [Micromonospora sp. 4G53]